MNNTIKENRSNGKQVLRAEHISSKQVVVTYTDFSKCTMSAEDYKAMHKDVSK